VSMSDFREKHMPQ